MNNIILRSLFIPIIPSIVLYSNLKNINKVINIGLLSFPLMIILYIIGEKYLLPEVKNLLIFGAIMGLIYSTLGIINKVPQKYINMTPIKFQISAIIIWSVYIKLLNIFI